MTAFTIITGVVTLLGFILQIRGSFPEYQRYFSVATSFLLGLTVGGGMAGIAGAQIYIPETITARNLFGFGLFGGTGLLIFVCFAGSLFIDDEKRRSEVAKIGSAVSGFFIFILLFFLSSLFPTQGKNYLTFDEQMQLINSAVIQKNYDRALILIEDQRRYLPQEDTRVAALEHLATEIRSKQVLDPARSPAMAEPSVEERANTKAGHK